MKRNQLVLRKVLQEYHTRFHLDGLHFPWSSMGAVFSTATEVCVWKKSPASHTRSSDKSCLVTLDLQTALDSSPSNSEPCNEQFKFSVCSHVCYILVSMLHCVETAA